MILAETYTPSHTLPIKETASKLWKPKQILFTPDALKHPFAQKIFDRVSALGYPVKELGNNRITGIKGAEERETYRNAKSTMAVVVAPPSAFNLKPIPPSADFQFHLAEGCPAHCQYCYLAGSLQGPPIVRVFANLPDILENTQKYRKKEGITTFEASCYTDPLGIEHLTGSLGETINFFADQEDTHLRWVSKYDNVEPLLGLSHNKKTRVRISLNAEPLAKRFDLGVSSINQRIDALRRLALPISEGGGGYPIGIVLAPIMIFENWREHYSILFDKIQSSLDFPCDLTFELITHRFTPTSKKVIQEWYPNTTLNLEEEVRDKKLNKYGGVKFVYKKEEMKDLRSYIESNIERVFPQSKILYWT